MTLTVNAYCADSKLDVVVVIYYALGIYIRCFGVENNTAAFRQLQSRCGGAEKDT